MITTGAGAINQDYTGELKVILFNLSNSGLQINKGDRVAQLVIEKIATPKIKKYKI